MDHQGFKEIPSESYVSCKIARIFQEHYEALKKVRDIIEQQNMKLQQGTDEVDGLLPTDQNGNKRRKLLNERKRMEAMLKLLRDVSEAGESKDSATLDEALIAEEGERKDEIRVVREVLIDGLKNMKSPNPIGVRRMGDLDCNPFYEAMKRNSKNDEALHVALNLCQLWNEHVKDPKWRPFKVIEVEGKSVEVVDDNDTKLKALKKEMGKKVHNAVVTALKEMIEYDPIGRSTVPELWNFKERRKASLKEAIEFLLNQSEQKKRTRLLP